MVYQNQRILLPGALDIGGGASSKSEKTQDKGFSKVLGSKMRSVYRAEAKNISKKAETTKPLSARSNISSSNEKKPAVVSAEDREDRNVELIKPESDIEPMRRSDVSIELSDIIKVPALTPKTDDLEQTEELQFALDEVLNLLKQLLLFAESRQTEDDNLSEETGNISKLMVNAQNSVKLETLRAGLEKILDAANQLEGTKTSEIASKFAAKLIDLLDDPGFARMLEEVSVQSDSGQQEKLVNLLGKMLNEAEKAKMDITRESIGEIIIPAMNSKSAQKAGHDQNHPQVEASDEQQTEASSAKEPIKSVEPDLKQAGKNPGNNLKESNESLAVTKPKDQKQPVSDFNTQTDIASFADIIKSEDTTAANIIKEPVDARTFVIRQVVEKVETLVNEDKKEVVMQLKPDSLGKITLRVIHERGEIVARFVAENDQVKSILESNMQMLRDSLQRNGVSVQSLSVSVGQQDTGRNTGDDQGWNREPGIRKHTTIAIPEKGAGHETYGLSGLTGSLFESGESEIDLTA